MNDKLGEKIMKELVRLKSKTWKMMLKKIKKQKAQESVS